MRRHNGQTDWTWNAHGGWDNSAHGSKALDNTQRPGRGSRGQDATPSPPRALRRVQAPGLVSHCVSFFLCFVLVCLADHTLAQERLRPEPPGYFGLPALLSLEDQPAKPPESPILPPLPPPALEERQQLPQQVRVFV